MCTADLTRKEIPFSADTGVPIDVSSANDNEGFHDSFFQVNPEWVIQKGLKGLQLQKVKIRFSHCWKKTLDMRTWQFRFAEKFSMPEIFSWFVFWILRGPLLLAEWLSDSFVTNN